MKIQKSNIRTRLIFRFSLIVTFILAVFSIAIYMFSANYRKTEYYDRLENKAVNTAKLLIEVQEIDTYLLKVIDKNTITSLYNEKVVVYDHNNHQIYNSLDDDSVDVSIDLLEKIRLEKKVFFNDGKKEIIGILFEEVSDKYVVIVSALDLYGRNKLNYLKWLLLIGFVISIGLTVYLGKIFAKNALKPITDIIGQVDKITAERLHLRVFEGNGTDEIAQLAITFNRMLERLELAFDMQRSFVSNASHELRTPLTAITGQIEVTLLKSRTAKEYMSILESVLEDIRQMNKLTNGLLDLAKASSDISSITFQILRLDEILWEARAELTRRKNDYSVSINFLNSIEDEKQLTVLCNHHLLRTALLNLMENACKFSSDHSAEITLSLKEQQIVLEFADRGIGIPEEEIDNILQPFFRAQNAKTYPGSGLGLSLTERIIHLHKGTLQIKSEINIGTRITITLPFMT